jgi:uncharacterized membrane protein YphA (DoxX/SURF4 family)
MITAFTAGPHITANQYLLDPAPFLAETPLTFLMVSLVVLIFGAGKISLDYLFGHKHKIV